MLFLTKTKNKPVFEHNFFLIFFMMMFRLNSAFALENNGHIKFSGAKNFRDLGMYLTLDGRTIKQGILFRSDQLSALTKGDLKKIAKFNIKRIYDLRNRNEMSGERDKIPYGQDIQIFPVPFRFAALDKATMKKRILGGQLKRGDTEKLMLDSYRYYVIKYRKKIARIFNTLAISDQLPAVVHCVSGKDRTGIVIALLLEILGVPLEVIEEDYLLTNEFWSKETNKLSLYAYIGSRFRTPRGEIYDLMTAKLIYLQSARDEIMLHYGDMDTYISKGLGLKSETLVKLRNKFLE